MILFRNITFNFIILINLITLLTCLDLVLMNKTFFLFLNILKKICIFQFKFYKDLSSNFK